MSQVVALPEDARTLPHLGPRQIPKCPTCGRARSVAFVAKNGSKVQYACGADPQWPGCGEIY